MTKNPLEYPHHGKFSEVHSTAPLDGTVRAQVKNMRKRVNMSQSGFAAALGLSKAIIGHYENGRRTPTPEVFERMRALSDADPVEMLPRHMPDEVKAAMAGYFALSTRHKVIFLKYLDPHVRNVRSLEAEQDND